MKHVIVPVDFSRNSDNAARYAAGLAREAGARITLLHVFDTPVVFTGAAMVTTARLDYSTLYQEAMQRLTKYYGQARQVFQKVKTELAVNHGLPSSRIAELALEKKADLIVIGATGKGALERMMLGSNAARLVKHAPCKVLVVPSKARYNGLGKLAYATDLSEESLLQANHLLSFARVFNAEIQFLYINERIDAAETSLKWITDRIKQKIRYPKISGYVCSDSDVNAGIRYFAKRFRPRCLVMYTHQRGLIRSLYQQSRTKQMASHPGLPLLVMHAEDLTD